LKDGLLSVLKFFGFLLVLPLVIASVFAFQREVLSIPAGKEQWFLWGAAIFLLIFLFLYNFKDVYIFGQNIVSNLLKFYQPLSAVGGFILPLYTVLLSCLYLILNVIGITGRYEGYLILCIGFSVALHIVLTAQQMYESDGSPIKAQYLLAFGLALVVNLIIISLLLTIAIPDFSFLDFFKDLSAHTVAYYQAIYKVLFVSPS
jgi:hypothetical protein